MIESDDVAPIAPLATLPAGLDAQWLLLVQVLLGASSAPTCAGESPWVSISSRACFAAARGQFL
ncbi:hypothetical protein [Pandoraea pnomenusa]|uniref:hypothetical protein n=1 Tax=Pandoraea pnomenusa TaxID=93220 RepID=UPI001E645236|nr:hypothetical protein [Pandoraea pnomenusa]